MDTASAFHQASRPRQFGLASVILLLHILAAQMFLAAQHRIAPHVEDRSR